MIPPQAHMRSLSDLLGPLRSLRKIRPPEANYADLRRFLRECEAAGLVTVQLNSRREIIGYETVLGLALVRQWRWMTESEAMGIPYQEAIYAFNASIERDREPIARAAAETKRLREKAKAEAAPAAVMDELYAFADETLEI